MNNSIEFVLKLKNLMGGELSKLSSTSQSTFTKMSKHVDQVTGRNKVLGTSFSELQWQISATESTIRNSTIPSQIAFARRELAALQRQSANHKGNFGDGGSSGGSGLGINGVAIGSMLGNIYSKAISMISAGAGTIIEQSFKKESAITGLKTFLGEAGANEAYKNIRQDASVTPFDTASLLEVNRALISAGVGAKDARRDTMSLANAVAAVGGGNDILSRMAVNMQQIKTVGKATAIDIRQFGIAGINIYAMLAKSTGKSIDQVKEMEVTYEQLQKSLAMAASKGGIYDGALAAQSQTKQGKYDTMKDNFMTAAADIGDAFSPIITQLLDVGVKFASSIGPGLQTAQPYIDGFASQFSTILDMVMGTSTATGGWADWLNIAKDSVSRTWMFIKNIGLKLWEIVSGIVEFVKNSEILKDVFRFVGWILEKVYGIISVLMDGILWLWDNVVKPILEGVDALYKWIKGDDGKDISINATKKTIGLPKKAESTIFENTKQGAANTTSGRAAGESVVGGGPKTINITVGKFFDNLQFTTLNTQESAEQMEKIMMEVLARVVYNGSKLV